MDASASISIRSAVLSDAEAISRVIIQTVQEINAKDYSPAVIEEVINNFSPSRVVEQIKIRQVFVATQLNEIIGTASLEQNTVRSVFVLPSMQRKHIGLMLMQYLEKTARKQSIHCLIVPSSIAAENFYLKLGYKSLHDEYYGEERTIIMEKHI